MNWRDMYRIVSPANKPIVALLNTLDGTNKTLLDLGCGKGILSDLAIERGFTVTSVDNGNTDYSKTVRIDAKKLEGSWDYVIAAGYPPKQLPKSINHRYFIYTTVRKDYRDGFKGLLYLSDNVYIKTNIDPLDNWTKLDINNKDII